MRARIIEIWGESAPVHQIYDAMVSKLHVTSAQHLTPLMFLKICPGVELPDVKKALVSFTGEELGLLEVAVAVFNHDGQMADLEEREVGEFLAQLPAYHEGDLVDPDKAIVYFKATPRLEALLARGDD